MRPLEFQLEINSHLWMFNRVKEFLAREGMLAPSASDEDVRKAVDHWVALMEEANRRDLAEH